MKLFKLSIKNIRKSVRDYVIYFFTLIIGVAIFYIFNAIESQSVLLKVTSSTQEIIKLMSDILSGISVFVSFVLGFLIIYASRFLMKRRNKEFGIYLTLGMGKQKISMILFFETLIIGMVSLIIGLGVGVCVSQFMSIVVANMFEADLTQFKFVFSYNSCIKTITYFGIIYCIVMIFNIIIINRYKLIDLIEAGKKTEKIKLKNPIFCTLIFVVSLVILGYAYYLVTVNVTKIQNDSDIYLPIALGAVSTFLIFWSLSGLMLKIVMSIKKMYYKGLNSFTLRQISSKVNTTVFSMTVICLMLFLTICVLSSSFSIRNSLNTNLKDLVPADLQLQKPMNLDESYLKKGYNKKQIASSNLSITEVCKKAGYDIEEQLKEETRFYLYEIPTLTLKDTLGKQGVKEAIKSYRSLEPDMPETIMRLSDYNQVAELYGKETYTLNHNQYMVVADFDPMVKIRNKALKEGEKIVVCKTGLQPKYAECKDGFIVMSPNHVNYGIFIVPDSVVSEQYIVTDNLIGNYRTEDRNEKLNIEENLKALEKANKKYLLPDGITKIMLYESSVGLSAMVTFIGLYLGMIFLISSAAILALKELSESADNIERFRTLRKLGADEKMIYRALFQQIGIFFLLPLILAGIHSIFGIKFCLFLLETFGNGKLLSSILFTSVILVVIYGGYFIITYWCSKNIIKEK